MFENYMKQELQEGDYIIEANGKMLMMFSFIFGMYKDLVVGHEEIKTELKSRNIWEWYENKTIDYDCIVFEDNCEIKIYHMEA